MAALPRVTEHVRKLMEKHPEIARQFLPSERLEQEVEVVRPWKGVRETGIPGTERMYGSEMIVLISTDCPAECGFCFRRDYLGKPEAFDRKNLDKLIDYLIEHHDVKEILITGGEPLTKPDETAHLASLLLVNGAFRKIRIGTSILRTDPESMSQEWIEHLARYNSNRKFEIAHHFNHPAEFSGKAEMKIRELHKAGIGQYVQTVLLKGINDNETTMRELAHKVRETGMEWYYLLHCMPTCANLDFRTSVKKGIDLLESFEAHRETTGRDPPKRYVVASPIGKIYVDSSRIVGKEQDDKGRNFVWLESRYKPENFPGVDLPETCHLGKRGFLEVKYLDGKD